MAPSSRLLVLNAGSSSLKFKLFEVGAAAGGRGGAAAAPLAAVAGGQCERLGAPGGAVLRAWAGAPPRAPPAGEPVDAADHGGALAAVLRALRGAGALDAVGAVGHRVAHGLDVGAPALVTPAVRATIEAAAALAPLHNPPALAALDAAARELPLAPHVAVFDTSFHAGMPAAAATYALPRELAERHRIRRYGFHGTNYGHLVARAAALLGRPGDPASVTGVFCHLGAGASMCAVKAGRSVDTTMGFTPLEGCVMATRCGDLDPGVLLHLLAAGVPAAEADAALNRRSGLLGLAGAADMREVLARAAAGDGRAALAVDVYVHRARRYLGAYLLALGGPPAVDAVVFSAGVGENSAEVRARICEGLEWAGIELDAGANAVATGARGEADVSAAGARVRVLVVPADEEAAIARAALGVAAEQGLWRGGGGGGV